MPIDVTDLKFHYSGIDTVSGMEIRYYYKTHNKCYAHIFYISYADSLDLGKFSSLKGFLFASGKNYHYMKYANYYSLYGCEYNDIDSFEFCQNENTYLKNISNFNTKQKLYKINENEYFSISIVRATVYHFVSTDLKYSPFFYHFTNNYCEKSIDKIVYKNVISRKYLQLSPVLGALIKDEILDCTTQYD